MKKSIRTMLCCIAFAVVFISSASAASQGGGKVTATSLNFRSEASTDATILACIAYSSPVVILEKTDEDWYCVLYQGNIGYMNSAYLENISVLDYEIGKGRLIGDGVRFRQSPSLDSETITYLYKGATVKLIGVDGEWYKADANGQIGYIHSDYIEIPLQESLSRSHAVTKGQEIVNWSKDFLGTTYVYGGSRPGGFDCSGFTYYLYNQSGIPITRTASSQWYDGTQVSKDELQIGDLVFFSSSSSNSIEHVGIYIGDGQFIHSSSGGGCVKLNNLSDHYYLTNYYGAVRVA